VTDQQLQKSAALIDAFLLRLPFCYATSILYKHQKNVKYAANTAHYFDTNELRQ